MSRHKFKIDWRRKNPRLYKEVFDDLAEEYAAEAVKEGVIHVRIPGWCYERIGAEDTYFGRLVQKKAVRLRKVAGMKTGDEFIELLQAEALQ